MRTNLKLGQLAVVASLLAVLAAAAGGWPTWRLTGPGGVVAMVAAALAATTGLLASLLIIVNRAQADKGKLAMTFLYTAPVRLAVTVLTAGGAWIIARPPVTAFLLWVAVFYMLLLAAEAAWLTRLLRTK